jgi:hypothetical protein
LNCDGGNGVEDRYSQDDCFSRNARGYQQLYSSRLLASSHNVMEKRTKRLNSTDSKRKEG